MVKERPTGIFPVSRCPGGPVYACLRDVIVDRIQAVTKLGQRKQKFNTLVKNIKKNYNCV